MQLVLKRTKVQRGNAWMLQVNYRLVLTDAEQTLLRHFRAPVFSDFWSDMLDAAEAHLQDRRGQGMDGSLVIEAFADSFARVIFVPSEGKENKRPTMFFAGTQSGWQFITAGTAFSAADYDALGIPESVR